MAELIGDFRQRYPGIELEIAEFGCVTMQQAVLTGELDLALTAEVDPNLATLPLFSHPLCAARLGWRGGRYLSRCWTSGRY